MELRFTGLKSWSVVGEDLGYFVIRIAKGKSGSGRIGISSVRRAAVESLIVPGATLKILINSRPEIYLNCSMLGHQEQPLEYSVCFGDESGHIS